MIKDNNKISKIKKDYLKGKTYNEIAKKYGVTYNELVYLAKKQKWQRKSNLSKVKKGNQNAKGNKGGPGAEKRNKRALKTGEYETIYEDVLDEDEQELMENEFLETREAIQHELKLISIREKRMLERIKKIKDKDLTITKMNKSDEGTSIETKNTLYLTNKIEEGLTRVQESKRRYLDSYHKIETDDRKLELELIRLEREIAKEGSNDLENIKDDSFIKALDDSVESAWDDYEEEQE